MTDGADLELELEPDPGWYPVPDEPDELSDWAVGLVRALAGPDAAQDDVRAAAEDVRRHGELAHELLVELAFVFLPEPLAPVVATCHVELVFGTAGDLPDLDQLERVLGEQQPAHLAPPDVRRVLLPTGPGVRQQVMADGGDGVTESVVFVVATAELDDALIRVTTTWRAVALGEPLAGQADRMAAALLLRTI